MAENDNEIQNFEVSKTKENEFDYRLIVDYSIAGLKRFLFTEELPKTLDGDDVFATLPVEIAVFDKNRVYSFYSKKCYFKMNSNLNFHFSFSNYLNHHHFTCIFENL